MGTLCWPGELTACCCTLSPGGFGTALALPAYRLRLTWLLKALSGCWPDHTQCEDGGGLWGSCARLCSFVRGSAQRDAHALPPCRSCRGPAPAVAAVLRPARPTWA